MMVATCQQPGNTNPLVSAQVKVPDFKHKWMDNEGNNIDVEIFEQSVGTYLLRFSRDDVEIKSITVPPADLGAYPLELFTLADGNLATLWTSGGPYVILNVFSYEHGKITPVLRASSKVKPEFAFLGIGVVGGALAEPHLPTQVIIITKAAWVAADKVHASKLMPVTADLYWWDKATARYRSKLGLPWKKRLTQSIP